jgi:hypothetical protein
VDEPLERFALADTEEVILSGKKYREKDAVICIFALFSL